MRDPAAVGYDCIAVFNAADALERLTALRPTLLITDVIMPEMNGIELAKMARAIDPECAILLSSGNAATQELLAMESAAGLTFRILAKPVPPRELLATIAGMLPRRA